MIFLKSAVGNAQEAFIQESYGEGINVIFSDDNNKGKTIVIQSMMYAIGNEPNFPTTFDYKQYYHYVEILHEGKKFLICRHGNDFLIKSEKGLHMFNTVSEMKRFWAKQIFDIPSILKDGSIKMVDPMLYFQLSFVGQDGRDTSNVANRGYYNKDDFFEMIATLLHADNEMLSDKEVQKAKEIIGKLKNERALLIKENKILKSNETAVSYFSSVNDKESFGKKLSEMEKIRDQIAELRKERNRYTTKRANWQTTKKELYSLNRTMDQGELRCMDCNSTNISFTVSSKSSYSFDVSTTDMRNEIIASIDDKIDAYQEEIERVESKLSELQTRMEEILSEEEVSLEAILFYKNEMIRAKDAEVRIRKIDESLVELGEKVQQGTLETATRKVNKAKLYRKIVALIRKVYYQIDPDSNQEILELFTKRNEVISGSEATVYYLAKMIAFSQLMDLPMPIVIDSFRAEELSSQKEDNVLEMLIKLNKQVILTATLKNEEMGKYEKRNDLTRIDYSRHASCKMLSEKYTENFVELIKEFGVEQI